MITYLKTVKAGGELTSSIKITKDGILVVELIGISIDGATLDTLHDEIEWYKRECNYKECTKQEFDNFYIEAVRNINELSKL